MVPGQWLTTVADVGDAAFQGYATADIQSASLAINGALTEDGLSLDPSDPVIKWGGTTSTSQNLPVALSPSQSLTLAPDSLQFVVAVDGGLEFGPAKMAGDFTVSLDQSGTSTAWKVVATDVEVGVTAGDAKARLFEGEGTLWIGKNADTGVYGANERSGEISGSAEITGVDAISLDGDFAARFDSDGNLELAGAVDLSVGGFVDVSGEFAVKKTAAASASPTWVNQPLVDTSAATVTEVTRGGLKTGSVFTLAVSEDNRVRTGAYVFAYNNSTARVTLDGTDDAVWRSRLTTALNALFGFGTVTVTGDRTAGFAVTLGGSQAGVAVTGLTVTPPADPSITADFGSTYVASQATSSTGAVHRLDLMPAGVDGSYQVSFDYQAVTNATVKLTAWDSTQSRFREGVYTFAYDGREVAVATQTLQGVHLSDAGVLANLTTGLETLFGRGNVEVSGSRSAGFSATFVGQWAGRAVPIATDSTPGLSMVPPIDPASTLAARDQSNVTAQATQASVTNTYDLLINVAAGATRNSDQMTFSFANGVKTAVAKFTNAQDTQARQIHDALAKLVSTGASTTKVFGTGSIVKVVESSAIRVEQRTSPTNAQEYRIKFKGDVAALGALTVANSGQTVAMTYGLSGVTTGTGVSVSAATGAVHRLDRITTTATGSFALSVELGGTTYTASNIAFSANHGVLEAALLAASNGTTTLAGAGVTVGVSLVGTQYEITFGGAADGVAMDPLVRTVTTVTAPTATLTAVTSGLTGAAGRYTTDAIDFSDFNTTTAPSAIAAWLEASETATGQTFASTGATVSVTYDSAAQQWVATFGGSAVGQTIDVMRGLVDPLAAPSVVLTQTATGATTQEVQTLDLPASGVVQLGLGGVLTAPLARDGLTATAIEAALEGLSSIGADNVAVTEVDGVFRVAFVDDLANRNVDAITVVSVPVLDIGLADEALADLVEVTLTAETTRQVTITRDGQTAAAFAATLQSSLQRLPGIGSGNLSVTHLGDGRYALVGTEALAGKTLPGLTVRVAAAVELPESYLEIGAANIDAVIGQANAGLIIEDAGFGLLISDAVSSEPGVIAPEPGYALYATGTAAIRGFAGLSMSATATVEVNTLGRAVDRTVKTGLTTPDRQVAFTDGLLRQEVTIADGNLTVDGLGTLSADFKVTKTRTETTVDRVTTTVDDLSIGLASASGALTPGGVGVTLADGAGALVMRTTTVGNNITQTSTTQYGFEATGSVSVVGVPGLTLDATALTVAYNRWGDDLAQDVETGQGAYSLDLKDNETRLRGQMALDIAGVVSASGNLSLEMTEDQSMTLTDGSSVTVDQLLIGGVDLAAGLGAGPVEATLRETDVALIIASEDAGLERRWIAGTAAVGGASIAAGVELEVTTASLEINRQLASDGSLMGDGAPVLDFSALAGGGLDIDVTETRTLTLASDRERLALDLTGSLVFGPARLSGQFGLEVVTEVGGSSWEIVASNVFAGLSANGAQVALSNGAGTLFIAADGGKTGTVLGTASVTGVEGLTFTGNLAASFDPVGNFQLLGDLELGIAGFAAVSGEFAVTKQAPPTVTPETVLARGEFADEATVTTRVEGGQTTATAYRLVMSGLDSRGDRLDRDGIYTFQYGSGTATIDTTAGGVPVSDALLATRLSTGLSLLFGSGNVDVTGSREAGFVIQLVGALAGRLVDGLTVTPPQDPSEKTDWGSITVIAPARAASQTRHYLSLAPKGSNISGAKFTLTVGGQTTQAIRYIADPTRQTAAIQTALDTLLGRGRAQVSFDTESPGVTRQGFFVTLSDRVVTPTLSVTAFTTELNGTLIPNTIRVAASSTALSTGADATGTVQVVDLYDDDVRGEYTLAFSALGHAYTTAAIDFAADADAVRTAILGATRTSGSFANDGGDVSVRLIGSAGNHRWEVTFGGATLGRHVPVMTGTVTRLETAPTVSLARTVEGSTTSETQRVVLAESATVLTLGDAWSSVLMGSATASEVQSALAAMAGIGAGNVTVTAVAGVDRGFDITFTGQRAAQNIPTLGVANVQTVDLRLPDGLADAVSFRTSGDSQWIMDVDIHR